jgi:putative dehydrogenase
VSFFMQRAEPGAHYLTGLIGMAESMRVAVIGLGAMGYGIAGSLLRARLKVTCSDIDERTAARFREEFAAPTWTASETLIGADVALLAVVSAKQCESILFGSSSNSVMLALIV